MKGATIDNMPKPYQDAFLALTPDKDRLQIMFERDRDRMIAFKDWTDEQIRSITAPTLLINGDKDVMTVESSVEMYRLIPNCQLAILPGIHGQYIGEFATSKNGVKDAATIMPLLEEFLDN
jgi:pimeloyl-ACP methyl ester carboxylesterase